MSDCGHKGYIQAIEAKNADLRAQLLEARAVAGKYVEALEEMALPPYKDSDLRSLMEWVNGRASAALSLDPGRYAKAIQGVIEAAKAMVAKHPDKCEHTAAIWDALAELKAAGGG